MWGKELNVENTLINNNNNHFFASKYYRDGIIQHSSPDLLFPT